MSWTWRSCHGCSRQRVGSFPAAMASRKCLMPQHWAESLCNQAGFSFRQQPAATLAALQKTQPTPALSPTCETCWELQQVGQQVMAGAPRSSPHAACKHSFTGSGNSGNNSISTPRVCILQQVQVTIPLPQMLESATCLLTLVMAKELLRTSQVFNVPGTSGAQPVN